MNLKKTVICRGFFDESRRVNCAAPFLSGQSFIYGTDHGIYYSTENTTAVPLQISALPDVTQVELMDNDRSMIALSGDVIYCCTIDSSTGTILGERRISSHASFFKVGYLEGREILCTVKSAPHDSQSTFKLLEPCEPPINQPGFHNVRERLRMVKTFFIPIQATSLTILNDTIYITHTEGCEICDPDTLDTSGSLNNDDPNLDFAREEGRIRPLNVFPLEDKILICCRSELAEQNSSAGLLDLLKLQRISLTVDKIFQISFQAPRSTSMRMADVQIRIGSSPGTNLNLHSYSAILTC